jgi:hypothetical protein
MALPSGVEHIIKKSINGLNTYIFPYSKTHLIWDNARQIYLNQILNDIYTNKQDTLIAGENISIVNNVISLTGGITEINWGQIDGTITDQTDLVNFVKSVHKTYYNNYTMYEGVAPYGSLATDAVWTITTIVSNDVGGIVSVNTATNQVWNYN